MKVNNLFKKVGSVMTTVALLGTLGTTAFATETTATGGISITSVNAVQKGSSDVYDVTVNYKTTKANTVGMTLLVYKNSDNKTDLTTGSYNGESMQIIGINQDAAVSGSSDSATEGHFTFSVTTNSTDANNYYLQKGTKALIAVSGDQCTPDYATFGINQTVDSGSLTFNKTLNANADFNEELTAGARKDSAKLISGDVETSKSVSLENATIGRWTKGADNTWTSTATILKADLEKELCTCEGDSINVSLTANVTVNPVDATKVKSIGGVSASTGGKFALTYSPTDTTTPVTKDAITGFLEKQKIVVTDSTGTVDSEPIEITKEMLSDPGDITDSDNDYKVDYTLTIKSNTTTGNSLLNAPADDITANIEVTVTKETVITGIELVGDPITVTVTRGTDDTATIDSIKSELEKAITTGDYKFDVTLSKGDPVTGVAVANIEYEWAVETQPNGTFKATLKAKAIKEAANIDAEMTGDVTVKIETAPVITVNEKPAGIYGDVDESGVVDMDDAALVMRYFLRKIDKFDAPNIYADVDESGVVDMDDAALIMRYFLRKLDKFPADK